MNLDGLKSAVTEFDIGAQLKPVTNPKAQRKSHLMRATRAQAPTIIGLLRQITL